MTTGEKRDQDLAHDALLPDDGLGELALEPPSHLGDALEGNRRAVIREVQGPIGHFVGVGSVLRVWFGDQDQGSGSGSVPADTMLDLNLEPRSVNPDP